MFLSKGYQGYFYLYFTDELTGKRKKISTKTKVKAEANKFLKSFDPTPKQHNQKSNLVFMSQLQPEALKFVQNNLTSKSVYVYKTIFKHFNEIIGDKPLKYVNFNDIELYKAVRVKTVSKTSVNIELRTMKALFNFAVRSNYLDKNPLCEVRQFSIPQKERLSFNSDETQKILETIQNPQIKNIVVFALLTGCRLGEILNVQWKDIDMDRKVLTIRNKPTFRTKNGKIRQIPISDRLYELLDTLHYKDLQTNIVAMNLPESYVFNNNGFRYNQEYITRSFKKYLRKAGVDEKFHFHCTRHTFLTQLAAKGVSIYHLKEIAGHSDVKTTMIYLHSVTENLRNDVNKMTLEQ